MSLAPGDPLETSHTHQTIRNTPPLRSKVSYLVMKPTPYASLPTRRSGSNIVPPTGVSQIWLVHIGRKNGRPRAEDGRTWSMLQIRHASASGHDRIKIISIGARLQEQLSTPSPMWCGILTQLCLATLVVWEAGAPAETMNT